MRELVLDVNILVRQTDEYLPEKELGNGSVNLIFGFDVCMEIPLRIHQQMLFDDVFVSIVRKDHPTIGDTLSLEQYIALDHALISPLGEDSGIIDEWLEQYNLSRKVALIVPHFSSAPLIIAQTDVVLTLPYRIAEKFAQMVPIKLLPTPIDLPNYPLSMIWHPLYEKNPADQWLREQVAEVGKQVLDGSVPYQ